MRNRKGHTEFLMLLFLCGILVAIFLPAAMALPWSVPKVVFLAIAIVASGFPAICFVIVVGMLLLVLIWLVLSKIGLIKEPPGLSPEQQKKADELTKAASPYFPWEEGAGEEINKAWKEL